MTMRMFLAVVAVCLLALAGCYEDEATLTLNEDGSGTWEQTITLSERMVVAMTAEPKKPGGNASVSPSNDVPLDEASLREKVGDALAVETLEAEELPDGGRRLTLRGTFDDATVFFASPFAEDMDLGIERRGDDRLAVTWGDASPAGNGGGPEPSLAQVYGMAKGMLIRRTVRVPGPVLQAPGEVGDDRRSATWSIDLRDREALQRTQAFVDANGEGALAVVFSADALAVDLAGDLAEAPAADAGPAADAPTGGDGGLAVEITGVVVSRAVRFDEEDAEGVSMNGGPREGLHIELVLQWPEGRRPIAYHQPVLTSLRDDRGNQLVPEEEQAFDHRQQVWEHVDEQRLTVAAKLPAKDATALLGLEGHVRVVAGAATERVELANAVSFVAKPRTGQAALDAVGFKLTEIDEGRVQLEARGERIAGIELVAGDETHEPNGTSRFGMNDRYTYTYEFDRSVAAGDTLVVFVRKSEDVVNVPFSAERVELP